MGINDYINVDKFAPGEAATTEPSDRRDRVDQCRVVWYQWDSELITTTNVPGSPPLPPGYENPDLDKATAYDISDHITSATYSKSMDSPAGSFSISLANTLEWQKHMKPGTWLVLYMSKEGDLFKDGGSGGTGIPSTLSGLSDRIVDGFGLSALKGNIGAGATKPSNKPDLDTGPHPDDHKRWADAGYRRCIGIIQRVAVKSHTSVDGAVDIEYVISGKDFGAVFEETELWFNMWSAEKSVWANHARGLKLQDRNLGAAMRLYFDVFFNPENLEGNGSNFINAAKLLGPKSKQWAIPEPMRADLNLDAKYFGKLSKIKDFKPTFFEVNEPSPLAGAEGLAWDHLKSISEPYFHEMFTELNDYGEPKFVFRPIPWAMDKSTYQRMADVIPSFLQHLEGNWEPSFGGIATLLSGTTPDTLDGLAAIFGSPTEDSRVFSNRVDIDTVEIESFDIGPAFHERYNFFLVDYSANSNVSGTAMIDIQKSRPGTQFPYQDTGDIQRHGFKPLRVAVRAYLINKATNQLFQKNTKSPNIEFIIEANNLLKDYHGNAEDFYSGTLIVAGNKNTKIGKIAKTDDSFPGLGAMAFYIEGYTDNFKIDANGTGEWMQTLDVTRGIEYSDLKGPRANLAFNTKTQDNEVPSHKGTFHKDSK